MLQPQTPISGRRRAPLSPLETSAPRPLRVPGSQSSCRIWVICQ